MSVYIETITGKQFFSFLLLGSTKRKKFRHMNSLSQYGYISKVTFKAHTQYFLKSLRKKIRFQETLVKVLKQHRQQYRNIAKKNFFIG